ncbi:MAG TPA: ABC transporter ATP-binding protein [bacterium]|nr:ABC transporter ATP-binding protein [bacterium]
MILELKDICKSYGRTEVIRNLHLQVEEGERHAVIGPNGAGKSTMYNLISGRHAPDSGEILLRGENIAGQPPYEIARQGLSRSFQITNIFHRLSVFENIRCALMWPMGYHFSLFKRVSRLRDLNERATQILGQLHLDSRSEVLAGTLTYAEQRALEVGMTIASGAQVILLDEPTAGMSRSETDDTVGLIRMATEGKTLLIVEHDMDVVFNLADRISVLVYGSIIATDTPERIRANAQVQEAYLGKEGAA